MKEIVCENKLNRLCIGFGTADLSGPAEDLVFCAIQAGYRLIDTAAVYGSEEAVGRALRRAMDSGLVKREELFVQTKVSPANHGYQEAKAGVEQSLNQLQVDYLDAYLIHWPVPRGQEETYREKNLETWQALTELQQKGCIRYTGVCNFLERHLLQLTENGLPMPAINQLEIHPAFQQRGLVRFCKERGITVQAWSPMGRGVLQTPEFNAMAERYDKNIGQLALRWSIQNGFIPLTRSSVPQHIQRNIEILDFAITEEDMMRLNALNTNDQHLDIWSYRRQQMY